MLLHVQGRENEQKCHQGADLALAKGLQRSHRKKKSVFSLQVPFCFAVLSQVPNNFYKGCVVCINFCWLKVHKKSPSLLYSLIKIRSNLKATEHCGPVKTPKSQTLWFLHYLSTSYDSYDPQGSHRDSELIASANVQVTGPRYMIRFLNWSLDILGLHCVILYKQWKILETHTHIL